MHLAHRAPGFALATVLVLATLLGVTAAVLLSYTGTEFRLNQRNLLRFEAKNAAEAALEYGAAELMTRLQRNVNFSTSELRGAPLTAHTSRKAVLFSQTATDYNHVAPTSLQFWASQYTESTRRYVDPNDPGNGYDPLRGQNVRSQTIRLLASATAATANSISETQYATQAIEIRDVFLFNYAIFYNIPLEFHPGADMTVTGPVHSNVNTYLTASSVLRFNNNVTTAGTFTAGALAGGRPTGINIQVGNGLDVNNDGVADAFVSINSPINSAIRAVSPPSPPPRPS